MNGAAFAVNGYPAISCLWSYYKNKEGKVTGIVLAAFGLANFFYVILITYLINPNNEKATLVVSTYLNLIFKGILRRIELLIFYL